MRLAYEQGLLRGRGLNFFQKWALLYWVYMDRRNQMEDRDAEMERQTFNLNPDRWVDLYRDQILGKLGLPNEEGEVPVMERLERDNRFQMSGADTPNDFRGDWGKWS